MLKILSYIREKYIACKKYIADKNFVTIWTFIIAVATVINAGVAYFMWNNMGNQYKVAEGVLSLNKKVFESTFRPWVGVNNPEVRIDGNKKKLELVSEIKNFGKIPALDVRTRYKISSSNEYYKEKNPVKDDILAKEVLLLFPDVSKKLTENLSYDKYIDVINGKDKFLVDFAIDYTGYYDTPHHTTEKYFYDQEKRMLISLGGKIT
ncbi:hypothetical protein KJ766_00240 [Patescibacteria group bacterium]|nr:hypothetical protein [Patescibacteria group bacterium]